MKVLNVAIIGCGDMGKKHAAEWNSREDARVAVVCDVDPERSSSLATDCDAKPYSDWRDAIKHQDIEVVSVCAPACYHRDIAVASAGIGKHVLCEKPMALTLKEADEMIDAASSNNVQLAICHQYRGLSRYRIIRKLVEDDVIGAPLFIHFMEMREVRPKLAMHSELLSGGPVHDMSGHLFDLARFLTECEAISVSAIGGVFGKGKERLASVKELGIDSAQIQVRMELGYCVTITINWGLPEGTPSYSHETIHGPNAVVYTQNNEQPDLNLGELSDNTVVVLKNGSGTRIIECESDDDGPKVCVADLIASIHDGKSGEFNALSARKTLELILAAKRSINSGKPVYL